MTNRLVHVLRTLWFMLAVAISCIVLSIPVFIGIFTGQGDRALPPGLVAWFWCWFRAAGVRPVILGREHIEPFRARPLILLGNHQSAMDIPILILACRGRIRFLAKKSLFWVPIVGWVMKLTGFTAIDRKSARKTRPALDAALVKITGGRNHWIIFPEGTRSTTGELLPYHRGTFNFARQAGVPVVPFAIDGGGALMPKGAWAPAAGTMTLVIGEPIPSEDVARLSPDELLVQARAFTSATLAHLRNSTAGSVDSSPASSPPPAASAPR
jgi:1-acyl-sn-glycerol-3-phosphate acyltransferase